MDRISYQHQRLIPFTSIYQRLYALVTKIIDEQFLKTVTLGQPNILVKAIQESTDQQNTLQILAQQDTE